MRKYAVEGSYEKLLELTRGKEITPKSFAGFIDGLSIPEHEKKRLRTLRPQDYVGLAERLAVSTKEKM